MCGIVGLLSLGGDLRGAQVRARFEHLLKVSESRGREASGVVWLTASALSVLKAPEPATQLFRRAAYRDRWTVTGRSPDALQAVMGHSRLTTHGSELLNAHNQPVQGGGFTLVHNGIVTNWEALWEELGLSRFSDLDSQVLPALLERHGGGDSLRVEHALACMRGQVQGTVSMAFVHEASAQAWLYTNHGSLYWVLLDDGVTVAFASESRFLKVALQVSEARQVGAGEMVAIDLVAGTIEQRVPQSGAADSPRTPVRRAAEVDSGASGIPETPARLAPDIHVPQGWSRFEVDWDAIGRLRRCSRGVLPQTMPFIDFDAEGVSNYARHHVPYRPVGEAELQARVERHLQEHGKRCLVAFSGGRDSSFALQWLKNAGMQPLAYTYDWGMVTDLARRNQARLCGALGVEHIIVSADIRAKRENIRRNVLAWLGQPHLGTVPLFMAGDKQYFWCANKLKQAYDLHWIVLAANPMERTYFKSGFAGVRPAFGNRPGGMDRLKLLAFYGGEFLRNPAFINRSLVDTAGAFLSYYAIPHDHLRLFDYLRWDEQLIDRELKAGFDWEHATDTPSTWRIGDGTAAFYNYIFMQVAGFTENDSLRHNQVLEGVLPRDEALALVARDNQPRFDSIVWYCRTIGLDPLQMLERIQKIPKLYASG